VLVVLVVFPIQLQLVVELLVRQVHFREIHLPEVEVVKVMDLLLHMLIHQLEVVLVVVVEVLIILLHLLHLQNEDWVMILQLVLHKEILPV
jgi:hypothetical protein